MLLLQLVSSTRGKRLSPLSLLLRRQTMLEKEGTGLVQVCEDVSPFIQEVSLVLKDFSSSYDYHDLDD